MIKKLLIVGAAAALIATGAQARGYGGGGGGGGGASTTTMTSAQLDTLVFVYQEEKVARDVYTTLGQKYSSGPFNTIKGSEQKHMDRARGLCTTYGADISAINESNVGEFVLPVMQEFYDTLVAQGQANLTAALNVGVAIEVMDIDDLTHAQAGMPSDVVNVYTNLVNGSWNHLSAFNNALGK